MDVRERLKKHLDLLFENAPVTNAAYDLKEELLANSLDRYQDQIARGMPAEDAYLSVVGSIGNVDELILSLPADSNRVDYAWEEERRSRSAVIVTVAVGLYILAATTFFAGFFFAAVFNESYIFVSFLAAGALCIVPTCMLVYNAYRWPKYEKRNDSVIEEFKQYTNDSKKNKSLRASISSLLWIVTVLVYLFISFTSGSWAFTWMIFLVAACIEAIINLLFRLGEMHP